MKLEIVMKPATHEEFAIQRDRSTDHGATHRKVKDGCQIIWEGKVNNKIICRCITHYAGYPRGEKEYFIA